jgi:hypothetical protein
LKFFSWWRLRASRLGTSLLGTKRLWPNRLTVKAGWRRRQNLVKIHVWKDLTTWHRTKLGYNNINQLITSVLFSCLAGIQHISRHDWEMSSWWHSLEIEHD